MAQRLSGVCYIKVNGIQLSIAAESIEAPVAKVKRERVMGLSGFAGYQELPQDPSLKFTALFTRTFPMSLFDISDGTVVVEFANGKVFVLKGAYIEGETVADGFEGKLPIELGGEDFYWK